MGERSRTAGQWQFRKVNRPPRVFDFFFFFGRGDGHKAGLQPREESLEFQDGGRGQWAPDIANPLSSFRHNWKRDCGFPGVLHPHQVVCAVPCATSFLQLVGPGPYLRFDFWRSWSFRLSSASGPLLRLPALPPCGCLEATLGRSGLPAPGDQKPFRN